MRVNGLFNRMVWGLVMTQEPEQTVKLSDVIKYKDIPPYCYMYKQYMDAQELGMTQKEYSKHIALLLFKEIEGKL